MDGPSWSLDKAYFSPKKKGKQCAAFGCKYILQIHFYGISIKCALCINQFDASNWKKEKVNFTN